MVTDLVVCLQVNHDTVDTHSLSEICTIRGG